MISVDYLNITSSTCLLDIFPLQDRSPILVQLDRRDNDIAGVDADRGSSTVRLVPLNPVDVDHPFLAVHLRDLSFTPLVFSPDNANFVILADR